VLTLFEIVFNRTRVISDTLTYGIKALRQLNNNNSNTQKQQQQQQQRYRQSQPVKSKINSKRSVDDEYLNAILQSAKQNNYKSNKAKSSSHKSKQQHQPLPQRPQTAHVIASSSSGAQLRDNDAYKVKRAFALDDDDDDENRNIIATKSPSQQQQTLPSRQIQRAAPVTSSKHRNTTTTATTSMTTTRIINK
jgi:hypothetical protein